MGTTPAGFEHARAEPNRFQVCRLNHSAIVPDYNLHFTGEGRPSPRHGTHILRLAMLACPKCRGYQAL